ncbi:hypothetical protein EMIHUDRAFT_196978 [Emiliania huxleyi CCMP1516]|uniref:NHL repeat-containing protein n=2 Tax=Emiliania huxleyi TaxID=2903 RepID=A0A0D3ITI1_EMIH1|nr:hypothetical protein EMIHUDRAFT_196978 [Emiliania huxleyi CCMP1516]EOD14566.1 hypothetical protein EMIHUDRAFT_196978 [Emiliania huxleyi CCMP1516]|eukprot:XP_005766995.1 hypothetical protein EMIHUDRAFT_196978 [Emiliania huxleyi CCMP1516]
MRPPPSLLQNPAKISVVLAHLGAAHDVAVAAALSHTWRSVALPRLASEGVLRPADGAIQILARSLKAKDPTFVACSPAASLVAIAESSQHRIVICSLVTGEVVRTLGKFGWASGAADGLNYPKGLAFDPSGEHLFVADRSNHRVIKMNAATGAVVAGVGSRGYGDGCFKYPQGVALADTAAHGPLVFVCDYGNDRIVALEPTALEWRFDVGEV